MSAATVEETGCVRGVVAGRVGMLMEYSEPRSWSQVREAGLNRCAVCGTRLCGVKSQRISDRAHIASPGTASMISHSFQPLLAEDNYRAHHSFVLLTA